ncbi:MAG: glycosyltransferase [Oscillospiraceae bacterium]|nr:glycosyltransferase [Oscillospiraceae bacterium]
MKFSVIMPTLNSSKHIKNSLNGLAAQTLKNFELIAIDSGSTDDTLRLLSSYNSPDMPVRIFTAPDCSPAIARNYGIDNTTGDYIAFCDSDDIMKPEMLEVMYDAAKRMGADITICDFDMVYPEHIIESFSNLSDGEFRPDGNEIAEYYYQFAAAPKPNNYVWSRIYKTEFLRENKARFSDTRYSEDNLFNLSLLIKKPQITHVGRSLYSYIQYDDSAMRTHIRRTNHGSLFLDSLKKASEVLTGEDKSLAEPILSIYAYTRVKSILFYSWLAKQPESETSTALDTFTKDDMVKRHLQMCIERDYIGYYCRLHSYPAKWEQLICEMVSACIGNGIMPDMSEVFA